jgi:EAL domain-containing protein (putative c-di-GMP-specific phosphodiesterase class I)
MSTNGIAEAIQYLREHLVNISRQLPDANSWKIRAAVNEREPETREELVQHLERMPPRLAVNVSPAQLRRGDFVDLVKDALAPVERATGAIDIEITVSTLMEISRAASTSRTGHSSLRYLARVPINSLKIDRSFIMQMSKRTEEQANLLCCDEAQGYLFGRPVPPEALGSRLRQAWAAVDFNEGESVARWR